MTPSFDALLADSGLPRADARVLLEIASGRRREWLIAHGDEAADGPTVERFRALAARRRAGEPVAYLVGHREFRGLRLGVGPEVLIPRPETEGLVELALARLTPGAALLDLGTGSGAIAIAIAHARPDVRVTATDRSAAALERARDNVRRLLDPVAAGGIEFIAGDWWGAVPAGRRFDVIVSNPPYIAEADPHLARGDLRFEPAGALASGADGLRDLRTIIDGAPAHLLPLGWLMVEHGHDQGAAVRQRMDRAGLRDTRTERDLQSLERISLARRPAIRD